MVLTREKNYVYFLANDRKAPKKKLPLSFSSSLLPKKVASTFWNTGIPHIIHESTKNSVFSKLQLPLVCLLTWSYCNQFQFFVKSF